ncbi:hypothetical protein J2T11_003203 [Paenarthrobacter nicotinovorans]|nr:hypothetical protein [Paenarthrobacter nicotinovorans]
MSPNPYQNQKAETVRQWLHTVAVTVSAIVPPVLAVRPGLIHPEGSKSFARYSAPPKPRSYSSAPRQIQNRAKPSRQQTETGLNASEHAELNHTVC